MIDGELQSRSSKNIILNELDHSPIDLSPDVYEFLFSNHYFILRDSGYCRLDQLIDNNPEIFTTNFEQTVRKALSLIYYSDGVQKLSMGKSRLREQLSIVFDSTKQLINHLIRDHILLLKVYATFFKYRVKLFMKEESRIIAQLFGEKTAESHVKILFDSFFLLVEKQVIVISPELPSPGDISLSTVLLRSVRLLFRRTRRSASSETSCRFTHPT